jgi:hypothetical protein
MTNPEQSQPHLRLIFLEQIQQLATRRTAQSPAMRMDWNARKQFGRGLQDEDLRRLVRYEEEAECRMNSRPV